MSKIGRCGWFVVFLDKFKELAGFSKRLDAIVNEGSKFI